MGYLIHTDYARLIQDTSLQQIISGNTLLKTQAELAALTEIKSYLTSKYDVAAEFTDTVPYNNAAPYKAGNRVYLDAPAYNASATYVPGQLVMPSSSVYRNVTEIEVPEPFTVAKWELLGAQYDLFYFKYPEPVFNINSNYQKDDVVFWKDKEYICLIPSQTLSHESHIQFNSTKDIPFKNVFPDDPVNGEKYWEGDGTYSIDPGSILDTDVCVKGDNRNQQLVLYTLDILIYHLYRRIPPQVVPELRIQSYYAATAWLKKVAEANDIVADITKLQPDTGNRTRYGSRPKQQNYY